MQKHGLYERPTKSYFQERGLTQLNNVGFRTIRWKLFPVVDLVYKKQDTAISNVTAGSSCAAPTPVAGRLGAC